MPNPTDFLTPANRALMETLREHRLQAQLHPEKLRPWLFRPCRVKVLLVADGLDFSADDFGLRAFVETLLTMPGFHVRFDITLGHIFSPGAAGMMDPDARIARRITNLRFDDPAHFTPTMYDQVWLFGISSSYAGQRGGGPLATLAENELRELAKFMDGGGGLFATGDHGTLGFALCSAIPRARSMRRWQNTSADNNTNEVSMSGRRRNDTNRIGPSAGSQFNDQSDDVPQTIEPRLYRSRVFGHIRFTWPHPLLCGPNGVIRVMPDHPHEGECVVPTNLGASDNFGGYAITEYPGGATRPLPELVSFNRVLAGTTSGGKDPTDAHRFGGICAYDGHRAGIGRVVTDATWHHFVNVNLVGADFLPPADPKSLGFLASAAGQAHFENIKAYFRNIATWISRSDNIACMRRRLQWWLVWDGRVLEAVLTHDRVALKEARFELLRDIGRHARDALGFYASRCQGIQFVLDGLIPHLPKDLVDLIDPWYPVPPKPEPDPWPWIDLEPLVDAALGGALVAVREQFAGQLMKRSADVDDATLDKVMAAGIQHALAQTGESLAQSGKLTQTLLQSLTGGGRRAN